MLKAKPTSLWKKKQWCNKYWSVCHWKLSSSRSSRNGRCDSSHKRFFKPDWQPTTHACLQKRKNHCFLRYSEHGIAVFKTSMKVKILFFLGHETRQCHTLPRQLAQMSQSTGTPHSPWRHEKLDGLDEMSARTNQSRSLHLCGFCFIAF